MRHGNCTFALALETPKGLDATHVRRNCSVFHHGELPLYLMLKGLLEDKSSRASVDRKSVV